MLPMDMRSTFLCILLLLLSAQSRAQNDQVVIADLKDWTHAIAFYVDASGSTQKELRAAVAQAREEHLRSCETQEKPSWLCSEKPFRYLRGITGVGGKAKSGFVCRDESWISRQRYYPEHMMTDDGCIRVDWHGWENRYQVAWPSDNS